MVKCALARVCVCDEVCPNMHEKCAPCGSAIEQRVCVCVKMREKKDRSSLVSHGARDELKRVHLYHSEKGWMNACIMLQWLRDVVLPYTRTSPAALILDSYAAHFTPAVRTVAMDIHLDLIRVPDGCTSELQSLGVYFNGPMLMKRKADLSTEQTFVSLIHRFSAAVNRVRASKLLYHAHSHGACCVRKG